MVLARCTGQEVAFKLRSSTLGGSAAVRRKPYSVECVRLERMLERVYGLICVVGHGCSWCVNRVVSWPVTDVLAVWWGQHSYALRNGRTF
jgi:hypothetical protein